MTRGGACRCLLGGVAVVAIGLALACTPSAAPEPEARTVGDTGGARPELPGPACPGATEERCNGVDDDCDGRIDEAAVDARPVYPDRDGDGFGAATSLLRACTAGPGLSFDNSDCDDAQPAVYPGAPEVCNGRDDNCSGSADDGELSVVYQDLDEDGVGNTACYVDACVDVPGFVTLDGDCNDADPTTGRDDACADVPRTRATPVFADEDRDGYGAGALVAYTCSPSLGVAPNALDCDDADPTVRPGALDACDQIDQDCNGTDNCSGWDGVPSIADRATMIQPGAAAERVGQRLFIVGTAPVRIAAPAWRADGCRTYLIDATPGAFASTTATVCMAFGAEASGNRAVWRASGLDVTRNDVDGDRTSAIDPEADSPGSLWSAQVAGEAMVDGEAHVLVVTQREPFTDDGRAALFATPVDTFGEDEAVWRRIRWFDGDEPIAHLVDLNDDGIRDLLVATPDRARADAWMGPLTLAALTEEAPMRWRGVAGDRFGEAIAVGDADADGTPDLLVGAPDGGSVGSGQVFILPIAVGDWSADDAIARVDADEPGARFGAAVVFDHGADAWLASAPGRRAGGASNGALWAFEAGEPPRFDAPSIRLVGDGDRAQLGATLVAATVDGQALVLVGAPGAANGAGVLYALDLGRALTLDGG